MQKRHALLHVWLVYFLANQYFESGLPPRDESTRGSWNKVVSPPKRVNAGDGQSHSYQWSSVVSGHTLRGIKPGRYADPDLGRRSEAPLKVSGFGE